VNVLVDRHHAGLYHSLQLLARRLGWTLYTPAGHDWWDEWYWSFGRSTYNDDRLAAQYLMAVREPDGEYPTWPIHFVTLDEARAMDFAYVIATLQDNQMGFAKFAREQGARFVVQVGNTGQNIEWEHEPIVLNSSEMPGGLVYHQEFDSTGMFGYREPVQTKTVRCFVHLLSETVCFPVWNEFRALLPDWTVLRYGHAPHSIEDPSWVENAKPTSRIADLMADAAWGWHDKPHGDGFGHVLHGWAAIGRPLIGHASHYRGKMAEPFWRDGETCIDLDRHSVAEAAEIVRSISADEHAKMCEAIRATFDAIVDYDREAEQIRELLA
jgi:hypothetical protein